MSCRSEVDVPGIAEAIFLVKDVLALLRYVHLERLQESGRNPSYGMSGAVRTVTGDGSCGGISTAVLLAHKTKIYPLKLFVSSDFDILPGSDRLLLARLIEKKSPTITELTDCYCRTCNPRELISSVTQFILLSLRINYVKQLISL